MRKHWDECDCVRKRKKAKENIKNNWHKKDTGQVQGQKRGKKTGKKK